MYRSVLGVSGSLVVYVTFESCCGAGFEVNTREYVPKCKEESNLQSDRFDDLASIVLY